MRQAGGRYLPKFPWKKYHRTRLVRWAKWYGRQHPTAIFDAGLNETSPMNQLGVDIGFHAVQNCGKQRGPNEHSYCNTITQLYPLKQYVPIRKILQFKYLIVIDGHTWPDRLLWMLQSNSIVLYAGVFVDYAIWRLSLGSIMFR
ncbi:hypothetical protein BCR33DRAFT_450578 [Rhizoclosmatium globosum]|uniref:Uncharacterized protein n=1 Tax=Rhizoclosmatium globosum TaxID=329046 RepID=A0A1Y2CW32_9FUNG|nr:hypothetical protein BCR33DRAFT_450578 [Rhizoclosmatium globosum]|eukprot:ORY51248.1 hypothetical protein BCR33DRAFT_450578 [Rhizoclosmatium globosum]